jgi:hypothetical protein
VLFHVTHVGTSKQTRLCFYVVPGLHLYFENSLFILAYSVIVFMLFVPLFMWTEQADVAAMLWTFKRKVLRSNLGRDIGYPGRGSSSIPPGKCRASISVQYFTTKVWRKYATLLLLLLLLKEFNHDHHGYC